ncbi:hypothetical protein TI05_18165, partial [Achromatium sp. WMS3]
GLRIKYRLPQQNVRGLSHELTYQGIENDALDVTDTFSTDAEIAHYGLRVLKDDLEFFPRYEAFFI